MRFRKTLAGIGAVAALAGATALVAVPATAQDEGTDDTATTEESMQTPFRHGLRDGGKLDTLAEILGVDAADLRERLVAGETVADIAEDEGVAIDDVVAALVERAEERLATAVEDERITQEAADERLSDIEERITDMVNGDVPFRFGHRGGPFGGPSFLGAGLDVLADVLGLDAATLEEQLRAGDTMADIAEQQGVALEDVIAALEAQATERLDQAVDDGRITQEQADEMLEGIADRIDAAVNGEAPLGGRGFGGHRHGFGQGGATDTTDTSTDNA